MPDTGPVPTSSQPITLTRPQAAALCGLTPAGFDVWVRKGIVPGPIMGTRKWSRTAIERAVAGGPTAVDVEMSPFEREMAAQKADPYGKQKAERARLADRMRRK